MTQNFFIIMFLVILVASMAAMIYNDIFGAVTPDKAMEHVDNDHFSNLPMQEIEPIASNANTISAHLDRMRLGLPEPLEPDFGN
jgi:hypothetical protein